MKQLLAVVLVVLVAFFALPASAATTWSVASSARNVGVYNARATCTTGSESAPAASTDGLGVVGLTQVSVFIRTGAGAMTAGGLLKAYIWNVAQGEWVPAPDYDLVVSALTSQAFVGFGNFGGAGRIAWVPSGVGLAVTIDINGVIGK